MCINDMKIMELCARTIKSVCEKTEGRCDGCPFAKDMGDFLSCMFEECVAGLPEDWDIDAE